LTASIVPALGRTSFGVAGDYIRIGALVEEFDTTLDEVVAEAEVVERDGEDESQPNEAD
jgi:hypothetical protein